MIVPLRIENASTDDEHRALYARQYFFGNEYQDYVADQRVHQRNFRLRLKILGQFVDPYPSG